MGSSTFERVACGTPGSLMHGMDDFGSSIKNKATVSGK
jgi:hypothetical protein